jgi:ribosomal protein L11
MKEDNLLANGTAKATKEVLGTCVSLGILVDGKDQPS